MKSSVNLLLLKPRTMSEKKFLIVASVNRDTAKS